MDSEIRNYKTKIELLEKRVAELENSNKVLKECLRQQYQFSAKVSNIVFEMDCLLTKKSNEIAHIESQLKNVPKESNINDFTIDLVKDEEFSEVDPCPMTNKIETATSVDINDFVIRHEFEKMTIMPSSDGIYKCPDDTGCYYSTSNYGDMERHFRIHTNEKPFECKFCSKVFATKANCIQHIRGHDDNLKLKCSVCAELFTDVQRLIKHTVKNHNGEGYIRKKRPRRTQQPQGSIKKRRMDFISKMTLLDIPEM